MAEKTYHFMEQPGNRHLMKLPEVAVYKYAEERTGLSLTLDEALKVHSDKIISMGQIATGSTVQVIERAYSIKNIPGYGGAGIDHKPEIIVYESRVASGMELATQ